MASCETARFLASILDAQNDRLAVICTSSTNDQASGPKLIAALNHVRMHELKNVLDGITSSANRNDASSAADAIKVAHDLLLDRPIIDSNETPGHDTYGHIFLLTTHCNELTTNFKTDSKLTLHIVCPGTLPQGAEEWPRTNGWKLRSLTGRGPRIHYRKKTDDTLDNLFGGLKSLVQHARSGQVLGTLTNLRLKLEAGPDCLIQEVFGKTDFALLQPGEVQSVVVKLRGKRPKAAESRLSDTAPTLDVSELFGELERMLLGFAATPILTTELSYKHPLLPDDTSCQITKTCEVRRFITAPGESMILQRPTSLLETENRVKVHQRLAHHYVSQFDLQGAVSALGQLIGDGDGRIACPGYVALLIKEQKFQARVTQRLSIMDSPEISIKVPAGGENSRYEKGITGTQTSDLADSKQTPPLVLCRPSPKDSRSAEKWDKPDAARKIWGDIRLMTKPNGSPGNGRTVSMQDSEGSKALRDAALRNKRSIGADTLRSLSSSIKGSTGLAAPWM